MSWSENASGQEIAASPAEVEVTDISEAPTNTLFIGDSGELQLDTHRALIQLLQGPSLDGRRHPKLWPILVRDEGIIRRRLAELFLELVIDLDVQVAFTRQAETGDLEVPLLLRRAQLTFIDSILLLHLRQRLTQADTQGERAVVSIEEIVEYLIPYERTANTDRSGFTKRVHASIEKIKKHSILQKIRSSDDRLEISPTLKLLFSAEEIQALIGANSLVLKLNVKQCNHTDWLQAELRQRFDYACVDSIQTLRSTDRALTREGQVKHNKARHEKDDRSRVDDRRNWVLGFDNREKLAIFEKQAQDLADTISLLTQELKTLLEQDNKRSSRAIQCQTLINLQWQEIDVTPLLVRISNIERQLKKVREGNTALLQISERIEHQTILVKEADDELRKTEIKRDKILDQIKESNQKLESLLQDPTIIPLTPYQSQELDVRFARLPDAVRLENLDRLTTSVVQELSKEIEEHNRGISGCEKIIENRFADFKRQWPMDAGDMDTSLASASDFFAKLVRLETDGLPAYEQRFFELLQNQSHQNLAALSTYLNDARKAILERMELVNDSLSQVPFNQSASQQTYLHIDATDRQLPEVKEFKQDIQQALSHAWSEDREFAESRFIALRRLVERLSSQDPDQKRWRDSVLDVRQHVEFIGREIDEGGVEVEIYRSGAGKSGGQRQKLATTCLAAALRYQLGGNEHGVPMYAPVVLDEAFDKADNEFTALAMNIFTNFGFQMIVATPLKSVMTLEPFIGGACFVDISDRRVSGVLLIEYDHDRQRLKLPEHVHEGSTIEAS